MVSHQSLCKSMLHEVCKIKDEIKTLSRSIFGLCAVSISAKVPTSEMCERGTSDEYKY